MSKLKIFLIPFLICCFAIIPWYLFAKYILKLNFNLEIFAILSFALFYFPIVFINIWKIKYPDPNKQAKQIHKFSIFYGKSFALIVSIQFFVVVMLLLLIKF